MSLNAKQDPETPGKRRITQADIARLAGVSKGAVSASLHGSGKGNIRVSPATVKKIRGLAKKEGYIPNQAARQLSLQKSRLWGILCGSLPSEQNSLRLAMLHKAAREKGYRVIVEYFDRNNPDLNPLIEVFHNLGVDGIICLHHHFPNRHSLIPRLLTRHFDRVVFIDQPKIPRPFFCGVDYVEAGRMLYRTLRECGPRPGLILNNLRWYSGTPLSKGFTEAWEKDPSHKDYTPIWTAEAPGEEEKPFCILTAHRALDSWVLPNRLTGLAVRDDERATFVLNALQERGIRVPQDIVVIGMQNERICELVRPTLSSVDLRVEQVIRSAVEMLRQLCEGAPPEKRDCWISPCLRLRQSCPASPA